MAGALATTIVVLGAAAILSRAATPPPFPDRLQSALRVDVFVAACLAAAIANVARLRFFSAQDISGSGVGEGSPRVRQANAILQNTLEQASLAGGAHMAVAATFSHPDTLLKALACLFVTGRVLFWVGYGHGPRGRAFGFALTFYPSALALAASASAVSLGWPA